jgi:hypothetical protein
MPRIPDTTNRHPDADRRLIAVERSDAIDAAAALALMARENRNAAKLRENYGPGKASHRRWLRECADVYADAARRMQDAADRAV